ncbi:Grx4 family monothiol glutaredoxin [Pseudomonadota bacterium]
MTNIDPVRSRIDSVLDTADVVLFMKGTREQPQCGFSATVIGILEKLGPEYATVNVLEDGEIREGIKEYSDWPTIPQLYVNKEFVGGCDIIKSMFNTGELHSTLGVAPPDRTPPKIQVSDSVAQVIKEAIEQQPGVGVHLNIDAAWNHQLSLAPAEGHEIKAEANGIELLLDIDSAQRANGMAIDMTETPEGQGFSIENLQLYWLYETCPGHSSCLPNSFLWRRLQ